MALSVLKGAQRPFPGTRCATSAIRILLFPAVRRLASSSSSASASASANYSYSFSSSTLSPIPCSASVTPHTTATAVHLINPDPSPAPPPLPLPWALSPHPHRTSRHQLHHYISLPPSSTPTASGSPSLPLIKSVSDLVSSALFILSFLPHLLASPMASAPYPYSSSNSDISTPRSGSPSSSRGRSSATSVSKRMSISSARRTSNLNPMSTIDIQALEDAMKAQQLDQLRGYRQDTYGSVKQTRENAYVTNVAKQQAVGQQVLTEPMINKGKFATYFILFLFFLSCSIKARDLLHPWRKSSPGGLFSAPSILDADNSNQVLRSRQKSVLTRTSLD